MSDTGLHAGFYEQVRLQARQVDALIIRLRTQANLLSITGTKAEENNEPSVTFVPAKRRLLRWLLQAVPRTRVASYQRGSMEKLVKVPIFSVTDAMNLSRLLVSFVSVPTVMGAPLADWNATHVFNPRWPPHAKFHNGQSMTLGAFLGFTALWLAWRKHGDQVFQVKLSIWLAALYWVAQATGALYPGAAFSDPEFRSRRIQHLPGTRIPAQLGLETVLLGMLAAAWRFARQCR